MSIGSPGTSEKIDLAALKSSGKVHRENSSASIIDIGDRIGLVEFHTKANALNDEVSEMLTIASTLVDHFDAIVIGNTGKHFCAGANLQYVLDSARSGQWSALEKTLITFQKAAMSLKYGPIPVVAAPFSSTLGGGCEVCLHSAQVAVSERTHLGLVETSVGLIPAGGGTKELCIRSTDDVIGSDGIWQARLQRNFQSIVYAKVSRSGTEAKNLFLSKRDSVVPERETPIDAAKDIALKLVRANFKKPQFTAYVPVLGRTGLNQFKSEIQAMREAKTISAHDALIQSHVATIMCGGDRDVTACDEQYLLDLEREAFLALAGTPETQERIESLLTTGKAVRN